MGDQITEFYNSLDALYGEGDVAKTEAFILKTARAAAPAQDAYSPLYLAALSELGAFYKGVSRFEESARTFEQTTEIIGKFIGKETQDYAVNINNLAGTYRLMGETEKSLDAFAEAKGILESIGETESFPYASILNNMSILYQSKGEYDRSIVLMERSIEICAKLDGSEEAIATASLNLASLYRLTGDRDKARQAADNALEMFKMMPQSAHHAAALNIRAALDFEDGDYEKAKTLYLAALEKTEHFFGENVEYAILCDSLSVTYSRLGAQQESTAYLETALRVFEKTLGAQHARTRSVAEKLDAEKLGR